MQKKLFFSSLFKMFWSLYKKELGKKYFRQINDGRTGEMSKGKR